MSASTDPVKVRELRERGFTVVPDVLPRADVPMLRELLERCIAEDLEKWRGKVYPDSFMVLNPMARALPFAQLLENERMQAYLSEMLTDTCILYGYVTSSMPPRGANYAARIHNDSPRLIPGYVTNVGVILPLDDFTVENGATYFLPGSFTRADTPSEEEFFAHAERVFPRAGDAVFFNARTFHFGGKNETERARHALTLNVCRSYMRTRFDYPRLMPKAIMDQLGEVGRRFLGFNVRMPCSLEEYYVPESERLYKAGQG
ncbi:MAG TPA: phytanoyl-CoA dioxygenase family protein [Polyangia bacterium]|nr:phytanoyl-CoA dioxygenase family protein [Polyangia bacterium]